MGSSTQIDLSLTLEFQDEQLADSSKKKSSRRIKRRRSRPSFASLFSFLLRAAGMT